METNREVDYILQEIIKAGKFEYDHTMHANELLETRGTYYAFPVVQKQMLGRYIESTGDYPGIEIVYSVFIRCMGTECGFRDALELDEKIRQMIRYIIKGTNSIVRDITCGELTRNEVTGRLERLVSFTIVGYRLL